jgi:hypothetical protein
MAPVAAGGMGEVYRARDERLARGVAIKVLPADALADPDRLRRFEQEAKATGALNHPNLLAVFDTGQHEGNPYVVFELLDGVTLRQRLGPGPLSVRKAVDYAVQIAQGLAAATRRESSTGTSSPRTCSLPRTGASRSWTSAWPSCGRRSTLTLLAPRAASPPQPGRVWSSAPSATCPPSR